MNWKEYISKIHLTDKATTFKFNPPVTNAVLQDLLFHLGLDELPLELEELYRQANGIEQTLDGQEIGELIWPASKAVQINREYRSQPDFKNLYMSFRSAFLYFRCREWGFVRLCDFEWQVLPSGYFCLESRR